MTNDDVIRGVIKKIGRRSDSSAYNPLSVYTFIDGKILTNGVEINGNKITDRDISMRGLEEFVKKYENPIALVYESGIWLFNVRGTNYVPKKNIGKNLGVENKIVIDEAIGRKEKGTDSYIW